MERKKERKRNTSLLGVKRTETKRNETYRGLLFLSLLSRFDVQRGATLCYIFIPIFRKRKKTRRKRIGVRFLKLCSRDRQNVISDECFRTLSLSLSLATTCLQMRDSQSKPPQSGRLAADRTRRVALHEKQRA